MAVAFCRGGGADLVLVGRDPETLTRIEQELRPLGQRVDGMALDLKDGAAAEVLCSRVNNDIGPIDILVNNIGGRRENIPTEAMPLDTWQRYLELNLNTRSGVYQPPGSRDASASLGPGDQYRFHQRARCHARHSGGGTYEAAKSALIGLTRAVGVDLGAPMASRLMPSPQGRFSNRA